MNDIELQVGPLNLTEISRAIASWPAMSRLQMDTTQSIRLAQVAQTSSKALESDISLTWMRGRSILAYAPVCIRRCGSGTFGVQGMPFPLRLPALVPGLDEQTRRWILDSFRDHLVSTVARTFPSPIEVWVPASSELRRDSIEARWLSSVPTVRAGVGLDVELAVIPEHSWSGLRKRYRSLINRGRRLLTTSIVTQRDADDVILAGVQELARLHAGAAGRVVYDTALWDVASDLIREGLAACVRVDADQEAVGGILLILNGRSASYAIGAFDRGLMKMGLPVGHTALWSSVSWLGEQRFSRLSLGTAPTPPPAEGKEAGIDQFKRGFATVLSPWLVTGVGPTN